MPTDIDILSIVRILGKKEWQVPREYGPNGWALTRLTDGTSVIVTVGDHDGAAWVHASIAHQDHMPTYEELVMLYDAVFRGKGWAYQVFAPPARHVNIHPYALHIWGRLDGTNVLPDFGRDGTI